MARRRYRRRVGYSKLDDTGYALSVAISLVLFIPLCILGILKWLFSFTPDETKTDSRDSYRQHSKKATSTVDDKSIDTLPKPIILTREDLQKRAYRKRLVRVLNTIKEMKANGNSKEQFDMATVLGAGTYVFGEDIPLGKYDLKAISGDGVLRIQKKIGDEGNEEWISFGTDRESAKSFHGLSLPQGGYFKITGNVRFEISRSKMIVIE